MTLSALSFSARINGIGGENRPKITRKEKRQNSKIVQPHSLQPAAKSVRWRGSSIELCDGYRFHLITFSSMSAETILARLRDGERGTHRDGQPFNCAAELRALISQQDCMSGQDAVVWHTSRKIPLRLCQSMPMKSSHGLQNLYFVVIPLIINTS
jgi:hypothetical protein